MFIILTHDNQSTLLSFSLFLSFVTNSCVAENMLSGSTDVGFLVSKAWCSSSQLYSLFHNFDQNSSYAITVLWSLLSLITWILCFDFKWLTILSVLEPLPLYNGAQSALRCWLSLIAQDVALNF